MAAAAKHKWVFSSRFKRDAFGWKSDLPIQRIKEALTEIKSVAKKEPVLAAEGAVLLIEKLSPALTHVDSSSGAMGSWVNKALETLVPFIIKAEVDADQRQKWLERLWLAFEEDEMPYIESLGDYWGEICSSEDLASRWADRLLAMRQFSIDNTPKDYLSLYFKGIHACYSALFTAKRFVELYQLAVDSKALYWHERRWVVKALVAQGKPHEAIDYALATDERYRPTHAVAKVCESILLDMGLIEEAYEHYALDANQSTTNVATYKAIVKKYPSISPEKILQDLVNQEPLLAGKWFATAKDAGYYDYAIHLANQSPVDIKTLSRAARDFNDSQTEFAFEAGMAALHWISLKQFYELEQRDIHEVVDLTLLAAHKLAIPQTELTTRMAPMLDKQRSGAQLLSYLARRLEMGEAFFHELARLPIFK